MANRMPRTSLQFVAPDSDMHAGRRARRAGVAVIGALVAAAAVAAVAAAAPAAAAPASEACSGGGACAAPEAEVRIIAPAEGAALAALAGAAAAGGGGAARTGAVVVEARGVYAKAALYLDGQFVSATPLGAGGRAELEFPLPGGAEALAEALQVLSDRASERHG